MADDLDPLALGAAAIALYGKLEEDSLIAAERAILAYEKARWRPIAEVPALNGGSTEAVEVWVPDTKCIYLGWYEDWDDEGGQWVHFGGRSDEPIRPRPTHFRLLGPEPTDEG